MAQWFFISLWTTTQTGTVVYSYPLDHDSEWHSGLQLPSGPRLRVAQWWFTVTLWTTIQSGTVVVYSYPLDHDSEWHSGGLQLPYGPRLTVVVYITLCTAETLLLS